MAEISGDGSGDVLPDLIVPKAVITSAWVALVGSLKHQLGMCWGTVDSGGHWTYEKADPPCFVCEALLALKPYHRGGD